MDNIIYVTLPNAREEFGAFSALRIQAQRERNADWRRKLIAAKNAIESALAGDPALLAGSGIKLRIVGRRERLAGGGFGLAAATFDALPQCVSWE